MRGKFDGGGGQVRVDKSYFAFGTRCRMVRVLVKAVRGCRGRHSQGWTRL